MSTGYYRRYAPSTGYQKRTYAPRYNNRTYTPRTYIKGRGAYKTGTVKRRQAPRAAVSNGSSNSNSGGFWRKAAGYAPAAGSLLGNYISPGIGGAIGSAAGGLLASIAGHGAYAIKRNTVFFPDQVPLFTTKQDGSIRMQHREFITDVVSSSTAGAFNIDTYPIDVANPTSFPFLSQIASNFEEWRMEGLVFEYKTTSGSISATGQLGTAVLATQYNSNALPFTNKQAMEAYTFASSTVVSASVIHPVECDPMQTPSNGLFYTNVPGTGNGTEDKRWQQLGNFNIATQGCAVSENIGELWVSYDVWLCKPRLISDTSALSDHWHLTTGINFGTPEYFGTGVTLSNGSDQYTLLQANTIYFDSSFNGNVSITYYVTGGVGAWITPDIGVNVADRIGAVPLNLLSGTNQVVSFYDALEVDIQITAYFTITSTPNSVGLLPGYGAKIVFGATTAGASFGAVLGDVIISQLPSDFN